MKVMVILGEKLTPTLAERPWQCLLCRRRRVSGEMVRKERGAAPLLMKVTRKWRNGCRSGTAAIVINAHPLNIYVDAWRHGCIGERPGVMVVAAACAKQCNAGE